MSIQDMMRELAEALGIEDKPKDETLAEYTMSSIQKSIQMALSQTIKLGFNLMGMQPFGLYEHPTDPYTTFVGFGDGSAVSIKLSAVSKEDMQDMIKREEGKDEANSS